MSGEQTEVQPTAEFNNLPRGKQTIVDKDGNAWEISVDGRGLISIVSNTGIVINPATEEKQDVMNTALDGIAIVFRTPVVFRDENFVVGNSPTVLDVNNALGQNGREFDVINDGAGDFTVSISNDGIAFGDEQLVQNGEIYSLNSISIDSIRITHVQNSAFRVVSI